MMTLTMMILSKVGSKIIKYTQGFFDVMDILHCDTFIKRNEMQKC